MGIPDSGFNTILEKLMASEMRKRVFNQLGAIINDLPTSTLSVEERKEAKLRMLDMIENACEDFFPEMHRRIDRGDPPKSVGDRGRTVSNDRSRDPNFPD